MWQPTHVKVTVRQAKGLLTKGKNGTNDAFVVIGIGKEKYQTSIKEKSPQTVEWKEECELAIPSQGNQAAIQLTVYHHNSLGIDEFLGQVAIPLSDFDFYEKPKYKSYKLKGKPEKDKKKGEKDRGHLELMVHFTVKSGSFLDISTKEKKHKSSLTSLKHLGGSLMSIGGGKDKVGLKSFARSVSSKMDKIAKPKKRKSKSTAEEPLSNNLMESQQKYGEADPGVISDDDDFRFDEDVKVNTQSSSPHSTMSRGSSLMHDQGLEPDFDVGSYDEGLSFGLSAPRIVDDSSDQLPIISANKAEKITSFGANSVVATSIQEESSLDMNEQSSWTPQDLSAGPHQEVSEERHFTSAKSTTTFYSPEKDDEDSAICVDRSSTTSSAVSTSNSSPMASKDDLKMGSAGERTLAKSSSAVTLRHGSLGSQKGKRVVSAAESWSFEAAPGVTRSGSLSEKRASQPAIVDEWERKLYGRTPITGSTENMSIDGSRTSLNSRASSTGPQEIRRDDSFTRLPEVKALTLERQEGEVRKPKRKGITAAFKRQFLNKSDSRDRLQEESRIVEGGNDRVPSPPTRASKLPQEIHDKFAGKSREDLLETIMNLQSTVDKQVKHCHDLEDYIDNLLLRVMDINPSILQAPIKKNRSMSRF